MIDDDVVLIERTNYWLFLRTVPIFHLYKIVYPIYCKFLHKKNLVSRLRLSNDFSSLTKHLFIRGRYQFYRLILIDFINFNERLEI